MQINVTKEAMKAETKLRHIKTRAAKAALEVNQKWAAKERAYLDTLPEEVRAVLRAAGVLPQPTQGQD